MERILADLRCTGVALMYLAHCSCGSRLSVQKQWRCSLPAVIAAHTWKARTVVGAPNLSDDKSP